MAETFADVGALGAEPPRPQLQLRPFPVERMPDNAMCVIVAESEGGKTTLGVDLMWHKRHLPAWFLFSTSEGCSQRLSQTIPPIYTYPTFDLEALEKVYKHQEHKIKKYTRKRSEAERRRLPDDELPIEERFEKNPCVGGYYEDCFADKKLFNKPIIKDLFKNGRHRMMFSIVPMQYIMDLPLDCRKQVKYWFLLREDSPETRKKLFHQVGGACKTQEIFDEIMTQCTPNYGCVVIDNICKSKKIEDRVFWYKAKIRPAFRVGAARYWRFHSINFRDNSNRTDPDVEEARAALGRQRRRRVPPTRLCHDVPLQQAQHPLLAGAAAQRYLGTPSMVEVFNHGRQQQACVEEMLCGATRSRKFDVAMLPADG